jgi:multidrug resistance efflux pump
MIRLVLNLGLSRHAYAADMGQGHILRVGMGASLLAAVAIVMAPHVTHHVSRSAVVNAPVIVIVAPFDGRYVSTPLMPGMPVLAGVPALELVAAEGMRLERVRLEAESTRLNEEVTALDGEIEALDALDVALARRDSESRNLVADVLGLRIEAVLAERRAAMARAAFAREEAERRQSLAARGTLSEGEAEKSVAEAAATAAEVDRLDAEVARLGLERSAALSGASGDITLGDGSYARQRRDELTIRRADLVSRRDRLVVSREAVESVAGRFGEGAESFERFQPVLDGDMVAWSPSPSRGAAVTIGTEVVRFVDCSRRFIEVPISEGAFDDITLGAIAEVWLKGASEPTQARVAAIRGAGSLPERGYLAAAPLEVAQGMLSVILDLPPANVAVGDTARRFCDVGRSAQVKLAREVPELVAWIVREIREASNGAATRLAAPADWLMRLIGQGPDDA